MGQTAFKKAEPKRPFRNRIRPAPKSDQGLTGATSTSERTLASWAASNIAIAPPHEQPTTSTSSRFRRSMNAETRSVCANMEQSS